MNDNNSFDSHRIRTNATSGSDSEIRIILTDIGPNPSAVAVASGNLTCFSPTAAPNLPLFGVRDNFARSRDSGGATDGTLVPAQPVPGVGLPGAIGVVLLLTSMATRFAART